MSRFLNTVLIFLFAGLYTISIAQITLNPGQITEFNVSPSDLFSGSVVSLQGGETVQIRCEITESFSRTVLLTISSPNRLLSAGNNPLYSFLPDARVVYGQSPEAQLLQTQHRLPMGQFEVCWWVQSTSGTELLDNQCTSLLSETYTLLNLVYPADLDTIQTNRPVLSWLRSGEFIPRNDRFFRLTLTEVLPDQFPDEAVRQNRAVFVMEPVNQLSVSYPLNETPLQEGKWYAWLVEWIDSGSPVVATEVWSFYIESPEPEPELKFVLLRKGEVLPVYNAVNDYIHFSLEDVFIAPDQLNIRIYTHQGERIDIDNIIILDSLISQGKNLFTLDLKPMGLRDGLYSMVVFNARGEKYSITFKVL